MAKLVADCVTLQLLLTQSAFELFICSNVLTLSFCIFYKVDDFSLSGFPKKQENIVCCVRSSECASL